MLASTLPGQPSENHAIDPTQIPTLKDTSRPFTQSETPTGFVEPNETQISVDDKLEQPINDEKSVVGIPPHLLDCNLVTEKRLLDSEGPEPEFGQTSNDASVTKSLSSRSRDLDEQDSNASTFNAKNFLPAIDSSTASKSSNSSGESSGDFLQESSETTPENHHESRTRTLSYSVSTQSYTSKQERSKDEHWKRRAAYGNLLESPPKRNLVKSASTRKFPALQPIQTQRFDKDWKSADKERELLRRAGYGSWKEFGSNQPIQALQSIEIKSPEKPKRWHQRLASAPYSATQPSSPGAAPTPSFSDLLFRRPTRLHSSKSLHSLKAPTRRGSIASVKSLSQPGSPRTPKSSRFSILSPTPSDDFTLDAIPVNLVDAKLRNYLPQHPPQHSNYKDWADILQIIDQPWSIEGEERSDQVPVTSHLKKTESTRIAQVRQGADTTGIAASHLSRQPQKLGQREGFALYDDGRRLFDIAMNKVHASPIAVPSAIPTPSLQSHSNARSLSAQRTSRSVARRNNIPKKPQHVLAPRVTAITPVISSDKIPSKEKPIPNVRNTSSRNVVEFKVVRLQDLWDEAVNTDVEYVPRIAKEAWRQESIRTALHVLRVTSVHTPGMDHGLRTTSMTLLNRGLQEGDLDDVRSAMYTLVSTNSPISHPLRKAIGSLVATLLSSADCGDHLMAEGKRWTNLGRLFKIAKFNDNADICYARAWSALRICKVKRKQTDLPWQWILANNCANLAVTRNRRLDAWEWTEILMASLEEMDGVECPSYECFNEECTRRKTARVHKVRQEVFIRTSITRAELILNTLDEDEEIKDRSQMEAYCLEYCQNALEMARDCGRTELARMAVIGTLGVLDRVHCEVDWSWVAHMTRWLVGEGEPKFKDREKLEEEYASLVEAVQIRAHIALKAPPIPEQEPDSEQEPEGEELTVNIPSIASTSPAHTAPATITSPTTTASCRSSSASFMTAESLSRPGVLDDGHVATDWNRVLSASSSTRASTAQRTQPNLQEENVSMSPVSARRGPPASVLRMNSVSSAKTWPQTKSQHPCQTPPSPVSSHFFPSPIITNFGDDEESTEKKRKHAVMLSWRYWTMAYSSRKRDFDELANGHTRCCSETSPGRATADLSDLESGSSAPSVEPLKSNTRSTIDRNLARSQTSPQISPRKSSLGSFDPFPTISQRSSSLITTVPNSIKVRKSSLLSPASPSSAGHSPVSEQQLESPPNPKKAPLTQLLETSLKERNSESDRKARDSLQDALRRRSTLLSQASVVVVAEGEITIDDGVESDDTLTDSYDPSSNVRPWATEEMKEVLDKLKFSEIVDCAFEAILPPMDDLFLVTPLQVLATYSRLLDSVPVDVVPSSWSPLNPKDDKEPFMTFTGKSANRRFTHNGAITRPDAHMWECWRRGLWCWAWGAGAVASPDAPEARHLNNDDCIKDAIE